MPPPTVSFEALATYLEALSSVTRLELLQALRTPRALHELRVLPSRTRRGEHPDRPLSRQAVMHHLELMQRAGLVRRIGPKDEREGAAFVLDHQRLFAMVDEIRDLAKLRPLMAQNLPPGVTVKRDPAEETRLPTTPRLLMAYGRDDGIAFPLGGPVGTRWRIGRSTDCEIALDYDLFLSSEHSIVERLPTGFLLQDNRSRNGTWVNWARLPSGGIHNLNAGDLITVGRSVLVFQP